MTFVAAPLTSPSNGRGGSYRLDDHDVHGNHLVAAPLSHGSNPNSNMAGRRREDDVNLVTAFRQTQDPITEENASPALGRTSIGMGVAFSENQRAEVLETEIARQLTSGGGKPGQGYSAVRQGAAVRRLTPTECERLQNLPDGWTDPDGDAPDSRRYAALGDAVTSSVARWIGEQLVAHLQRQAA
jgi:site-specific DNA-cytosine methylase